MLAFYLFLLIKTNLLQYKYNTNNFSIKLLLYNNVQMIITNNKYITFHMVNSCMHGCNVPLGKPAWLYRQIFNSLPNDNILDQSKLKAFAEDNINVNKRLKFDSGRVEKRCTVLHLQTCKELVARRQGKNDKRPYSTYRSSIYLYRDGTRRNSATKLREISSCVVAETLQPRRRISICRDDISRLRNTFHDGREKFGSIA